MLLLTVFVLGVFFTSLPTSTYLSSSMTYGNAEQAVEIFIDGDELRRN